MASKMEYESQGLLHEMFVHQARLTPDKIAVFSGEGQAATFRQLDEWTDALAVSLRHRGLVPDRCVAIYMEKSIEFVVAYIAILRAGAAYLPIDTSYPEHLVQMVFEDADPLAVTTSPEFAAKLEGVSNVIEMGDGWFERVQEENRQHSDSTLPPVVTLDNLAYIVYSSGTTGKPKGIMCPHRGAVFSYHWRHTEYPYTDDDKEACNIFFVWELLRALLKGTPMFIIPNTVIYDPPLLCRFIEDHKITRILFTPSLLETILNTRNIDLPTAFASLKQIWFCGEVVTTVLLGRCIKQLPWIQFVNLYSVSECHDAACEDLTAYYNKHKETLMSRKFCPVGTLLPGVKVVILNKEHQCQPVGVSGEIFVGGPTLARGYLNRPELQAYRFLSRPASVPESCGGRLYRTGDWGYLLSDGSLEICGRCDSLVKIRGYSIEIQAVETNLMALPMVHACVVLVMGEEGQNKFLVAYIVPEGDTTKKDVRAALKRRLPFYMIPSFFVFLKTIPMVTASGKLDKKALPPFDQQSSSGVEGSPSTETEVKLARMWTDVLQIQDIDIHESFFDLGGHSLFAAQLLNKICEDYQIQISVHELFSYPTVFSLAKLIDTRLAKPQNGRNVQNSCPAKERDLKPSLDLQAEVNSHDQGVVNLDIQLRAFWRTFHHGHHFHTGRVLLTGATGFLGAFLLKELLLHTKLLVYCLVREIPHMGEMERVRQTLRQYGVTCDQTEKATDEQQTLEHELGKRVTVLKGNIALMNIGLNEDDYTYLCTDIDFIIHAAAAVNLAYPYSALHGPNVLGTGNIVLFASTGKVKPIHYISTDAVFPNGMKNCSEDDDISDYHDKLQDGYSQSKWVAEQLVQRANQRGLPVTIYRLGNMAGDRQNAFWNPQDFTLLVLQACAKHGIAPEVNWNVEMTPVDFAAHVIVRLTQDPPSSMSKIFHIINTKPLKSRWIFEWMYAHGYALEFLPFSDWRQRVLQLEKMSDGRGSPLSQLLESYIRDESFFSSLSSYRNENLLNVLSGLGLDYAYIDTALLRTYFEKLSARKVIVKNRSASTTTGNSPLQGKVAIVTGASSGIGSAIVRALTRNGAKVAMAARRVDRMKDLEHVVKTEGGIAILVKTDVLDRQEVLDMVQHTESTLGPVDILVNNAGVMYYTMMKNVNIDQWHTQIDINCKGVTNCIAGVLPGMISRGKGHIVNMSSDAGKMGFPGLAVYSGTKFFIEGMSQGLRHEVKDSGVKVTCIQPGNVKTDLFKLTTDLEAKEKYDESSSVKILEPEDIANAIVYAVTQADYVAVNEILIEPRGQPI